MKMIKWCVMVAALVLLTACAVTGGTLGGSPEGQIVNGANTLKAVATLGSVSLRNKVISASQAESYLTILKSADGHLMNADARLTACRKATGSNPKTEPDPCKATVMDDVALAVSIAGSVKETLDGKQK